ncbi:MAG: glucose-6-phosphate isomerase [Gammaproteobacteria bacterium]|nr:glucose-6-phosphate isomerase [Gammaproteobacteria bacterium]
MPERKLSARYPTDLAAWRKLREHFREDMRKRTLRDLFMRDSSRFSRFSRQFGSLHIDLSKNLVSAKTLKLLLRLARETRVADATAAMFSGDRINRSENRSVLHVALRAEMSDQLALDVPGVPDVWGTLTAIEQFVSDVQGGRIVGINGQRLTEIVNIGIGGSDLGPVMASNALRHYWKPGMNFHSVSNIDGTQLVDLTERLNPEETLFVICSKTFTTLETMTNAEQAKQWITRQLGDEAVAHHFAAASTNHEAMDAFGINPAYRFGFWDWVGGRYSIWSAVGLSLALVIGMQAFRDFLAGARRMDLHFRDARPEENLPLLMGLVSVWYNNFFGAATQAVLPYDNRLDRFPAYLQQLHMESNGKGVREDGRPVKAKTGTIIWGEAGSNAQHSFYQLLHQGTRFVPVDFILPVKSSGCSQEQQDLAIANCLAQSEALMDGYAAKQAVLDLVARGMDERDAKTPAAQRMHPGNRPSTTILFERLTPAVLGQLIALYEHKVFVEGVIWGINSFDQFGVELGKKLATSLAGSVSTATGYEGGNDSTRYLLELVRMLRTNN